MHSYFTFEVLGSIAGSNYLRAVKIRDKLQEAGISSQYIDYINTSILSIYGLVNTYIEGAIVNSGYIPSDFSKTLNALLLDNKDTEIIKKGLYLYIKGMCSANGDVFECASINQRPTFINRKIPSDILCALADMFNEIEEAKLLAQWIVKHCNVKYNKDGLMPYDPTNLNRDIDSEFTHLKGLVKVYQAWQT